MRRLIPALLLLAAAGRAGGPAPVKLAVDADSSSVPAGERLVIRIRLLDSANQPVTAPKELKILIQARLPSGEVKALQTFAMRAGASLEQLVVTPPGRGPVYLWAKNPELLPGGAFVMVRETVSGSGGKSRPPLRKMAPLPAPAGERALPRLALRYSPDRAFLADGKDAATVQAFLLSEPAARNIRLNLYDSSGTLRPVPLTIPQGSDSGRAALTFTQPGTVTVEFMGSEPTAAVDGNRTLHIAFTPPITHATLAASPPAISLVDKADLVLTLRDDRDRPVATGAARHVVFAIQNGRGDLARKELDIAAGQFEARTTFQPAWFGSAEISAATPNLLTASVPVRVTTPLALLLCSLAGGLAGGYFSYLKRKRSGRRRIAIGLVTGFLFYWACLFIGLAALTHAAAVNPLSAFALSTFGGWLQTDVFKFWKPRLKP